MAKITKAEAEQKARDFVATFESKQACWDYLKSLGVFWGMSDETATNDELAMAVLIEEYLYGLDPSKAKTTGHYISRARMDRFTCHPGDFKIISKAELDQMVHEGKAVLYT